MNNSKHGPESIPREYFKATFKHLHFQPGTVKDFAFRRQEWDHLEKLSKNRNAQEAEPMRLHVQNDIKLFQNEVTKAYRAKDIRFFQTLIRSLKVPTPVEVKFNSVVATLRAFNDLYEELGHCLPSKQEIKDRAARYLKKRGWPPISDRQWPRIVKAAGLKDGIPIAKVKHGAAKRK